MKGIEHIIEKMSIGGGTSNIDGQHGFGIGTDFMIEKEVI